MRGAFVAFCLLLAALLQSQQPVFADGGSILAEYQGKYLTGLTTTDPSVIKSVIKFMDQLIAKNDNSVMSVYYNKAQLLFRLKRFDEAVETMRQSRMAGSDYYLATLLIRLGRITEGRDILQKNLGEMEEQFWNGKADRVGRVDLFAMILVHYRLLNKDGATFVRQVTSRKALSDEDIKKSPAMQLGTREEIVKSLWPK